LEHIPPDLGIVSLFCELKRSPIKHHKSRAVALTILKGQKSFIPSISIHGDKKDLSETLIWMRRCLEEDFQQLDYRGLTEAWSHKHIYRCNCLRCGTELENLEQHRRLDNQHV
jgi:hypothetical protein